MPFMPLEAGARLGPYEIIAPIGAGGMGEVYRARDTRLDRTVAVKVLTGALAADPESRQRFEQEARAIAALNDPHICTIHDVGRHDDLDYLVLEYLEGETLADRLRRAPGLSVDEALAIAIQIADGARPRASRRHRPPRSEAGQRDAARSKRTGSAHPTSSCSTSAWPRGRPSSGRRRSTRRLPATMAPSHGGDAAAARRPWRAASAAPCSTWRRSRSTATMAISATDIFAFGCVLYEMLAGRKAFEGSAVVTVIAAITSSEPPPIAALALSASAARSRAEALPREGSRAALAEHRRCRRRAALDCRPCRSRRRLRPGRAPHHDSNARAIALVIVLAAIAALAGWRALRPQRAARELPTLRFEISPGSTDDPSMALSPDGRQLAFIANQNGQPMLWVRPLDAVESRALAGTAGREPAVLVARRTQHRVLRRREAEADRHRGRNAAGGRGRAERPRRHVERRRRDPLRARRRPRRSCACRHAAVTTESVTQLNAGSGPAHRLPQFLPDGKRFLFSAALGTADTNGMYVGSLDKTPPVRVLPDETGGRFAAPDKLLTIKQGALQAYTFDPASGAVQGEPAVIAQGFAGAAAIPGFTVSDNGVLAYRIGAAQRRQLVWVNRQGSVLSTIGEPDTDYIASPELSPDEKSVVVFLQRSGDNDIWVIELARNLARRITDGPPADAHPLWDPDGRHVVFSSQRFGGGSPARQALDRWGGGAAVQEPRERARAFLDARSPVHPVAPRRCQDGCGPRCRVDGRGAARGGRGAVAVRRNGRTVLAGRQVGRVRLQRERPSGSVRPVVP